MRIVSWNINGIRAALKKGFDQWLLDEPGQIIGLQEVRALPEQIPAAHREPEGWHVNLVAAERKGYSGVGLFSKMAPDDLDTTLGNSEMDAEGRVQIARFGQLTLANVYFPNGSGKNRDNSRIPFKLDFYQRLFEVLEKARANDGRVLVMGDFNTAHQPIDLARPKQNVKTSGFCPEEREEFDRWINAGWVDTFRHYESGPGHYTWWSQRQGVRQRNIGWRIDYVLASSGAMPFLKGAFVQPDVMGSDHCPIGVDLDDGIIG